MSEQSVPDVALGAVIGLMEILDDLGGREDVFRLASQLRMELDDILPVMEAGVMLGFIDVKKGDAELTELGGRFLASDMNARKRMVCAQIEKLGPFKELVAELRARKGKRMPRRAYLNMMLTRLYSEDARALLHTLIDWGRYGELIGYNEDSDEIYLDQPITL